MSNAFLNDSCFFAISKTSASLAKDDFILLKAIHSKNATPAHLVIDTSIGYSCNSKPKPIAPKLIEIASLRINSRTNKVVHCRFIDCSIKEHIHLVSSEGVERLILNGSFVKHTDGKNYFHPYARSFDFEMKCQVQKMREKQ